MPGSEPGPGRHLTAEEPTRRELTARVAARGLAALVILAVLVGGTVVGLAKFAPHKAAETTASPRSLQEAVAAATAAGCARRPLLVAADARIADAVATVTAEEAKGGTAECPVVVVTAAIGADLAAAIARPAGVGLGNTLPDIWLPDSSVWADVARRSPSGARRLTALEPSVASSPIVIAMARPKAQEAGWPNPPGWRELLAADAAQWRLGTSDPRTSTPALASLMSIGRTPAAVARVARRVQVVAASGPELVRMISEDRLDAAPSAEADLVAGGEDGGEDGGGDGEDAGTGVVAGYDSRLGSLDFPLLAIAEAAPGTPALTPAALRRIVLGERAQAAFQSAGLRSQAGTLAKDAITDAVRIESTPGDPLVGEQVTETLPVWSEVGRRSRLLVVLDRSGSMDQALPGGRASKIELAKQSLRSLVAASAPDTEIGLWTFTTAELVPGQSPTRLVTEKVVPVAALGEAADGGTQRSQLLAAIDRLAPDPQGGTPLYRAITEAYEEAMASYAYGRFNAVIILTDGRDEDETRPALPLADLLDDLQRTYDGIRPVKLIALAYGEEVDLGVLQRLSETTGGSAYQGLTQARVTRILDESLQAG